jgi:hypothetical protein
MSNDPQHPQSGTPDTSHTDGETWTDAAADRAPTPDEEAAADRAAADVDLGSVAEHEQEMMQLGADVQGEGQIEP